MTMPTLIALLLFCGAVGFALWTNEGHHWFWRGLHLSQHTVLTDIREEPGPAAWLLVAYGVAVQMVVAWRLLRWMRDSWPSNRRQGDPSSAVVTAAAGKPLAVQQEVPIPTGIYDLEVAAVTHPASEGLPDLILASRGEGRVIVRRGAGEGALFESKNSTGAAPLADGWRYWLEFSLKY